MSFSDEAVLQAANNVALSVQVALDPKSDLAARQQAHQFYEEFRSKSNPLELCAVGFSLCIRCEEAVILSGLQMIENVAKYQWNTLADRQPVKDRLLQLMHNGLNSGPASSWPSYLQEALSKVIVEIAKREWPQLWPDLFPKLFEMATVSDLALRVLRRMAEDVVTLQLVDCSERRRELSHSLSTIAPDVITTLFNVLIASVKDYNASQADSSRRRGKVCLGCLLPYIEWQNPMVFTQENRLNVLFALLPEKEFQLEAADCIIQLLERKSVRKEDKYVVPKICLDEDCSSPFLKSIDECSSLDFLRKVGDLLTLVGQYVSEGMVNVENFFTCVLKLISKPQAVSVLGGAFAINQYLKAQNSTPDLTGTAVGKALICSLNGIFSKLVSTPPSIAEKEELSRLKTEFASMLRSVGKSLPKLYKEVNSLLHSSLIIPNAVQAYQWETLVLVIDGVASSISHEDKEMIEIGLRDLEHCYTKFKEETVLELKSIILSTVSALFVFLSLAKQAGSFGDTHLTFMHSVLESVFHCFSYENVTYARDIRRHAAALMIKLSTKHTDLMSLAFNFIHSTTMTIASKLSSMEYTTLIESLLITCNCWGDTAKQSAFIKSLLVQMEWNEIATSSESLQAFIKNLQEPVFQDKRVLFVKNLTLLNSAIRRVKKISKPNSVLQQSHSVENSNTLNNHGTSGYGEAENQHPAYDVICPILPTILKLVKTIHSVYDDPQMAFLMDLNDQERSHIMGIHFSGGAQTAAGEPLPASISSTDTEKPYPERLKIFIQTLADLTYGILGGAPTLFSPKFYHIPQVGEAYLSFVGWNNMKMDDFRLRGIIRTVFSPFLINCPLSQFETVLKPFLENFCPFMLDRMISRWAAIEAANNSDGDAEDQEVLENTSLRLLSKDYIDLLHKLLELRTHFHINSSSEGDGTMGRELNDFDSSSNSNTNSQQPTNNEIQPGEIGQLILQNSTCFQPIIHLCIHALCWDDSNLCLKSSRCILLAWKRLVDHSDLVSAVFGTTLRALCLWYENEANIDCLIKVLDLSFRSCYQRDPILIQLLKEWGCSDQDIQKLIALCNGPKVDKKRKDFYRRMVFNNPALEKNKSPKAQWLRGMPQLQLAKTRDAKQKSPDIDLSECFSVIHHV